MSVRRPSSSTAALLVSFSFAALLSSCDEKQLSSRTATTASNQRALIAPPAGEPVCQGTGAHDTHVALMSCETCHPCPGRTGFDNAVTLVGGTTTAGGTFTPSADGSAATCSVGCHNVSGGSQSVSWNGGKLMCSSCHTPAANAAVTSHPADTSSLEANRSSCQGCHKLDQHLSGIVRVDPGDGTSVPVDRTALEQVNPACQGCHDGDGRALATKTPPLLAGWNDAAGDFHGARAGTGYGGTLAAPYARGQGSIGCIGCHDAHQSGSAYLFRAEVNGTTLANTVSRAGVGAEALCTGCHLGARHQTCIDCHRDVGVCVPNDGFADPPSTRLCQNGVAVDPAGPGTSCFFCHGHEGIVNFPPAEFPNHHPNGTGNCTHCHAREGGKPWLPATVDTTRPALQGAVSVSVGLDTATVSWTTSENATTFVEYGVGSRNRISGTRALATTHQVVLTGLTPSTTYSYRVRSADSFRNLLLGPELTFTTGSADAPPAPVLSAVGDVWSDEDRIARLRLTWTASIDPQGDPVDYFVQLDDDPQFGSPIQSPWLTTTYFDVSIPADRYYYWRVMARDHAHGLMSPWSAVDRFYVQGWYE